MCVFNLYFLIHKHFKAQYLNVWYKSFYTSLYCDEHLIAGVLASFELSVESQHTIIQ